MTLHGLFDKMKEKGFYYFEGKTNDRDESICIEFSTLHNGRGDTVELALNYSLNKEATYDATFIIDGERLMLEDVDVVELFDYINKLT